MEQLSIYSYLRLQMPAFFWSHGLDCFFLLITVYGLDVRACAFAWLKTRCTILVTSQGLSASVAAWQLDQN